MKKIVYSGEGPKPLGVYSQGTVGGGLIFVSGQVPVDPKTSKFIEQDIKKKMLWKDLRRWVCFSIVFRNVLTPI